MCCHFSQFSETVEFLKYHNMYNSSLEKKERNYCREKLKLKLIQYEENETVKKYQI